MKTDLILEEDYVRTMEEEVVPWLNERRTVLWACRHTGQRIYCERYFAEDPRGAVLIAHGFKESATKYAELAWYFLHEGYHVYIIDHCGHGRSYRLVDDLSEVHVDNYKRYIGDLLAVAKMARKDIDRHTGGASLPLYLFGHSMGGGVGIAAAAREPGLFDRLVLTAPMIQPLTGSFSFWQVAIGSAVLCLAGRQKDYAPGNHPYQGIKAFEDSSALSRPRYEYYQALRDANPLFETSAASIGWIHATVQLYFELMHRSLQSAGTPILMFQAEWDGSVSKKAQDIFAGARNERNPGSTILRKLPGTKHEIYSSSDAVNRIFWEEVFRFLAGSA